MRTRQSLGITLPPEFARMVKAKVASGDYTTESEVICEALRILARQDAAIEKWLRQTVVPTYDAVMADAGSTVPADRVFAGLRAHHAGRVATPEE